jgi:hypothetical protein
MPNNRNKGLGYKRIPYEDIEKLLQVFNKQFNEFLLLKGFPMPVTSMSYIYRNTGKRISGSYREDIERY